jgi:hypothetical protein
MTHKGKRHAVHIPAVTLRNHKAMIDWSAKIDARAKEQTQGVQLGAVRKLLETFPDALEYIDALGNVNADTIRNRIEYIRADEERKANEGAERGATYDIKTDEEVQREAMQYVTGKWTAWIKDNPDAAAILMFQATEYPTDIDSLLLGIDCIKAVVCRTKTNAETLALIDGDIDTDFWQDVDAAEVADFCTGFRDAYKAHGV